MGVTTKSSSARPVNTLGAGVHLAVITQVKYARDSAGDILTKTETGEPAIEIEFKNGKGLKIAAVYWLTEKALWVFQRLCDAIGVVYKDKDSVSVRDVVGQRLYIVVGVEFEIRNGILQKDTTGKLIMYSKLLPHFIKVIDPSVTPALEGDPNLNDGLPGRKFIVNKPETLPEDFEQQFREGGKQETYPATNEQNLTYNVISDTNQPNAPF